MYEQCITETVNCVDFKDKIIEEKENDQSNLLDKIAKLKAKIQRVKTDFDRQLQVKDFEISTF